MVSVVSVLFLLFFSALISIYLPVCLPLSLILCPSLSLAVVSPSLSLSVCLSLPPPSPLLLSKHGELYVIFVLLHHLCVFFFAVLGNETVT